MIIAFDELKSLRGRGIGVVDGAFDPLHRGHIEYFREASRLGVPILCNVASDSYVSTKHPVFLQDVQRAAIIDAIRYIDYTHINPYDNASAVIRELRPRYYIKGTDWRTKFPQAEIEACAEHGVELVYLDTVLDSSSKILRNYSFQQNR